WVAMISIGSIYALIPWLYGKKEMHSVGLVNTHFWLATIGTVLYIASMWVAGISQGLMWRAVNDDGTLTYTFVESLKATYPYYVVRMIGGLVFLSGMFLMAYNVFKTMSSPAASGNTAAQPA
ncbi:MAG TPA: cytochrome C oxidase Cbb3, partial [Gammaproteobacteria bacterium]|nr:cytochrome C oxidase Cbb3 [Gammaproteobacteria bacterium]